MNTYTGKIWKQKDERGYVRIYKWNRKTKRYEYRYEHRIVAEQSIGRPLTKKDLVHHKNHNPSDNRIENLEILSQSEHRKIHSSSIWVCAFCRKEFYRSKSKTLRRKTHFCSHECYWKSLIKI